MYLCAVLEITASIWTQCPPKCTCSPPITGDRVTSLTVDCQTHAAIDQELLSDQLDSLLSSNLTYGHLTSLSIVNTPLTHVPPSVCRLKTLVELHLDYNSQLTRLPDNCLTNLSNLVWFVAVDNAIEILQDGVFDGLTKLQYMDLHGNKISSIGLSVFSTSSDLSNLFTISLRSNNLTSLEPWPLVRGLIGSFEKIVKIDLSYNKIAKFTNNMGMGCYESLCVNEVPFVYTNLQYNNIRHFIDILYGWKIDFEDARRCYHTRNGRVNLMFMYYGNFNITCDCIDYYFFRVLSLQEIEYHLQEMSCKLIDPLTRSSSRVNGFKIPLELFVCELTERCPVGCICVHRPANATLHVYCSNRNLTVLPFQLPDLPDSRTKYKLDFSGNRLRRLERRAYFVNTSILDVSNSGVTVVIDWEEIIVNAAEVNLFSNNITSLPPSLSSINMTTKKLNIANNPWDCSCDNKWMSEWLVSIADRLEKKILCYSPDRLRGKNIVQISKEEFCVDPSSAAAHEATKRALTASLSPFAGVFAVLSFVAVVVYCLRVRLYTRWKFHPFDRDECLGEDMDYDVFLSCSNDDNLPRGNAIREHLEQLGYLVCYPPRDFIAGNSIFDNIHNAVVRSKRTVCLLTRHFIRRLESSCC